MSRRINKGGAQESPGGPWDEEWHSGRDGAPRDGARRTVLVMGSSARRGGTLDSPGPGGFVPRPAGSSPILNPRKGPPPDSEVHAGASSGGVRKLPFMALSDIIRQQHRKEKVSYIYAYVCMEGRHRRLQYVGILLVHILLGCFSPAAFSVVSAAFPGLAAVCAAQVADGAAAAVITGMCDAQRLVGCCICSLRVLLGGGGWGPWAQCVSYRGAPVCKRVWPQLLQPQDSSSSPTRQHQQQNQNQTQQGLARNALFGSERAPLRVIPSGAPAGEHRRVREVSGGPQDAREGGVQRVSRVSPESRQYPVHVSRTPHLRERPSRSPGAPRGPSHEHASEGGPRHHSRGPDGYVATSRGSAHRKRVPPATMEGPMTDAADAGGSTAGIPSEKGAPQDEGTPSQSLVVLLDTSGGTGAALMRRAPTGPLHAIGLPPRDRPLPSIASLAECTMAPPGRLQGGPRGPPGGPGIPALPGKGGGGTGMPTLPRGGSRAAAARSTVGGVVTVAVEAVGGAASSGSSKEVGGPNEERERWKHRREELQRRLRGATNGSAPAPAAATAERAPATAGGVGSASTASADWQQQQHQQQHQQQQHAAGYGWGPPGTCTPQMMQQHPHLMAPEGFYSAQGPTLRGKRRGCDQEGPPAGTYALQGAHPFPPQGVPHYPPPGMSPACWQQEQQQQQRQYGGCMWRGPRDEGFMPAPWPQVGPYGGPRGPPDEYSQHHPQQQLQQQYQQQQPQGEAAPSGGGGPAPLHKTVRSGVSAVPPQGGSAVGSSTSGASSGSSGGGPPPRACKEFLLGGRCSRGPACEDLHIPPQEYHKFNPHTLMLLGSFLSEAPELRRRFAADAPLKQQNQQQIQQQQQLYDQQQQRAPQRPFGGPTFRGPHCASGPPMGPPYASPPLGGGPDMQAYPQVYGSPPGGPRSHPFGVLEGGYGPPGGPRGRRPGGPGGPHPEGPPPFILRTPRPMQGPPLQGPSGDVPKPPPPEPPRGICAPWYPGGPPPPPFRHPAMGLPGVPGALMLGAVPPKKRKSSASKAKAKKQRKQQQLLLQQQQGAGEGVSSGPSKEASAGAAGGAGPPQQHQHQAPEEVDAEQQHQEGDEDEGAAGGGWERTTEQETVLMEYFNSKAPEFLASDAYLEGWSKRDLIEYFYDQYLQQDMTAAEALASATSYVENPEAYGLVGGAPPEDEAPAERKTTIIDADPFYRVDLAPTIKTKATSTFGVGD
ncbi:collagen alpha-1(III) chain [Cyclospora cayetanensis]|uniref:Collagen alpha-1(III) chain n=1 Tax=Cyclospora cayetanensis TaxID=88456 RepID=A0A6P6S1B5_9EIME|nr:collagen alpha-1(III) chain [Cyclospora cayetanensis]